MVPGYNPRALENSGTFARQTRSSTYIPIMPASKVYPLRIDDCRSVASFRPCNTEAQKYVDHAVVSSYSRARLSGFIDGGHWTSEMYRVHEHRRTTTRESHAVTTNKGFECLDTRWANLRPAHTSSFPYRISKFPCWTETTTLEARPVSSLLHSDFPCLHRHLKPHKQVPQDGVQNVPPPTRSWSCLLQLKHTKHLCRPEFHLAARHLWFQPLLPLGKSVNPSVQVRGSMESSPAGSNSADTEVRSPRAISHGLSTIRIRSPTGQSAVENRWSVLSSLLQHSSPPPTMRNFANSYCTVMLGIGTLSW